MIDKTELISEYIEIFGDNGENEVYFAPSRVNMIGEHIDYNGGFVLPCALKFGTYGVGGLRNDNQIKMYSKNFREVGIITVYMLVEICHIQRVFQVVHLQSCLYQLCLMIYINLILKC
jgi:galactokinase